MSNRTPDPERQAKRRQAIRDQGLKIRQIAVHPSRFADMAALRRLMATPKKSSKVA